MEKDTGKHAALISDYVAVKLLLEKKLLIINAKTKERRESFIFYCTCIDSAGIGFEFYSI